MGKFSFILLFIFLLQTAEAGSCREKVTPRSGHVANCLMALVLVISPTSCAPEARVLETQSQRLEPEVDVVQEAQADLDRSYEAIQKVFAEANADLRREKAELDQVRENRKIKESLDEKKAEYLLHTNTLGSILENYKHIYRHKPSLSSERIEIQQMIYSEAIAAIGAAVWIGDYFKKSGEEFSKAQAQHYYELALGIAQGPYRLMGISGPSESDQTEDFRVELPVQLVRDIQTRLSSVASAETHKSNQKLILKPNVEILFTYMWTPSEQESAMLKNPIKLVDGDKIKLPGNAKNPLSETGAETSAQSVLGSLRYRIRDFGGTILGQELAVANTVRKAVLDGRIPLAIKIKAYLPTQDAQREVHSFQFLSEGTKIFVTDVEPE